MFSIYTTINLQWLEKNGWIMTLINRDIKPSLHPVHTKWWAIMHQVQIVLVEPRKKEYLSFFQKIYSNSFMNFVLQRWIWTHQLEGAVSDPYSILLV